MTVSHGVYHGTPVRSSAEAKTRCNPFPWNGQFSPQFVPLLRKYCVPESVVLDPFMGSGTVLLGFHKPTSFGGEIHPAAVAMAKTYRFANVSIEERVGYVNRTNVWLRQNLVECLPLFHNCEVLKENLVDFALNGDEFQRSLGELLVIMVDFDQPGPSLGRVLKVWKGLAETILGLPYSAEPVVTFNSDARDLPLNDSSVNFVLTSPPYINVFNYHQRFRASLEALNWNMLKVAESEFGANRKHRSNRFLTVIQFCLDVAQVLEELCRVCTQDARLILVVGRESKVCGTTFFNGEIVAEVAHRALGYALTLRQERGFVNRYGRLIYEDILHFRRPERTTPLALEEARGVARQALKEAYPTVPEGSSKNMKSALEFIEGVAPSPLFNGGSTPKLSQIL